MTEEESRYRLFEGYHETYTVEDEKNEMPLIRFHGKDIAKEFLNHLQGNEEKIRVLKKENKKLKDANNYLEALVLGKLLLCNVKQFIGDWSKRYKYDVKNDMIYDQADTHGKYFKILDKKEIVLLLNGYSKLLCDTDEGKLFDENKQLRETNHELWGKIHSLEKQLDKLQKPVMVKVEGDVDAPLVRCKDCQYERGIAFDAWCDKGRKHHNVLDDVRCRDFKGRVWYE